METLPSKWAVYADGSRGCKPIYDYFNKGCGTSSYQNDEGYFHYPNLDDGVGFRGGNHCYVNIKPDYTRISYQDFERLVLKIVKPLLTLPAKWAIKRDKNNYNIVNQYFNDGLKELSSYTDSSGYLHYPAFGANGFCKNSHFGFRVDDTYIEITTEDFKRLVLKNDLPEKWYIWRNTDNHKIINNFFNSKVENLNCYGNSTGCIGYPSTAPSMPWSKMSNSWITPPKGYVEITFEQFKKHVMNDQVSNPIAYEALAFANNGFYLNNISIGKDADYIKNHATTLGINKHAYNFSASGPYVYDSSTGTMDISNDIKNRTLITGQEFLKLTKEFFINNKTNKHELQTAPQSITGREGFGPIRPYSGKGQIASSIRLAGNQISFGQIKGGIIKSKREPVQLRPF